MGAVEPAVMVIDDDDHLREAMSLLLEEHGYEVAPCADAREALDRLNNGAAPDVILLDLRMPRMDGWEFRLVQKRDLKLAHIPVVALSADVSAKARAIDAHAYLSKPVDDALLLQTIAQLVHALAGERLRTSVHAQAGERALAALASSVVHEVNNPLSFVIGNLELAHRKLGELGRRLPGDGTVAELRRALAQSQCGAERIKAVMRAVGSFEAARGELDPSALPSFSPEASRPSATAVAREPSAEVVRAPWPAPRRARVLVVDDEPLMCELIGALLASDYDVVTFTDPRAALVSMLQGSFDVVLCDLMMPELTGMELHERIAAERPELGERFVFISGGAFTDRARSFLANTRLPQVRKPFHRQQLIDVIEAQLTLLH